MSSLPIRGETRRRTFAALAGCAALTVMANGTVVAAETPRGSESDAAALESGPAVGETVPNFYSRAVTGPLMNRSVCYVCRNGDRPVVMVVMRRLAPELKRLMRNIDRIVDRNRADGVRGFGVYLDDDPQRAISRLQTFAFEGKIETPLTVGTVAVGHPSCVNIHDDATVTVVLYRDHRVVRRFALRDDELSDAHLQELLGEVVRFAGDAGTTSDAATVGEASVGS